MSIIAFLNSEIQKSLLFRISLFMAVLIFSDPCYFGTFHLLSFPSKFALIGFIEIKCSIILHLIFLCPLFFNSIEFNELLV